MKWNWRNEYIFVSMSQPYRGSISTCTVSTRKSEPSFNITTFLPRLLYSKCAILHFCITPHSDHWTSCPFTIVHPSTTSWSILHKVSDNRRGDSHRNNWYNVTCKPSSCLPWLKMFVIIRENRNRTEFVSTVQQYQ